MNNNTEEGIKEENNIFCNGACIQQDYRIRLIQFEGVKNGLKHNHHVTNILTIQKSPIVRGFIWRVIK
jgi:hypothetical protein